MIQQVQYGVVRRGALVACFLLACFFSNAQSDYPEDTLVTTDIEADTAYASAAIDTITFRSTPDSTIKRLQQMKAFEYANDPAYWKKKEEVKPRRISNRSFDLFWTFVEYLLYGVFIVALAYIVFKILTESKIILWKRKGKQMALEPVQEIIEEKDLGKLIAEAEQQQQYRLATRFRYMQLLENLHARQLIKIHSELTNWDYIRQLGTHPLSSKFKYLTIAYEYVWYGEFDLGNDQYVHLQNKFETFFH